jgi:hypothetical protein
MLIVQHASLSRQTYPSLSRMPAAAAPQLRSLEDDVPTVETRDSDQDSGISKTYDASNMQKRHTSIHDPSGFTSGQTIMPSAGNGYPEDTSPHMAKFSVNTETTSQSTQGQEVVLAGDKRDVRENIDVRAEEIDADDDGAEDDAWLLDGSTPNAKQRHRSTALCINALMDMCVCLCVIRMLMKKKEI